MCLIIQIRTWAPNLACSGVGELPAHLWPALAVLWCPTTQYWHCAPPHPLVVYFFTLTNPKSLSLLVKSLSLSLSLCFFKLASMESLRIQGATISTLACNKAPPSRRSGLKSWLLPIPVPYTRLLTAMYEWVSFLITLPFQISNIILPRSLCMSTMLKEIERTW